MELFEMTRLQQENTSQREFHFNSANQQKNRKKTFLTLWLDTDII